jgi:hypothetical protein
MALSLCVVGIAAVGFGIAQLLKARRNQQQNVQTLFNVAK